MTRELTSFLSLIVSSQTLKVNFSPYILDILLNDEVDPIRHKATVKDGTLNITLFKKTPGFWGQCESDDQDLETIRTKKAAAIEGRKDLDSKLAEQMKDRKIEEERHSVRQQMALDDAERTRLENTKQQEKEAAEKEVYEVLSQLQRNEQARAESKPSKSVKFAGESAPSALPSTEKTIFEEDDYDMIDDLDEEENAPAPKPSKASLSAEAAKVAPKAVESSGDPDEIGGEDMDEDIHYIPPPRSQPKVSSGGVEDAANHKVRINFTPRVFPTPMRESKAAEEEDWIAKNRRHLKNHGVLGKHVNNRALQSNARGDISEEDPTWLKAKGDDFYRTGDIRSALNAYSAALDIDETYVAAFSNRAACYLQLQMYDQCKLDCDAAIGRLQEDLQQMTKTATAVAGIEPSAADQHERDKLTAMLVKLLVRRGGAHCHMGRYPEAIADYSQAQVKCAQLSGGGLSQLGSGISSETLEADLQRIKHLSHVESLKKAGDALYAEKDIAGALQKYDEVLSALPLHVSALSNRSACHMLLQNPDAAIRDCNAALELLQLSADTAKEQRANMVGAMLPPKGSDKRKQWLLRTLTRRAVALIQLDRFDEALDSYYDASKIDPENASLKQDIEALERAIDAAKEQSAAQSAVAEPAH